ncbi:MAG: alpha-ketoacid dehydrogenase subunit beta, partial [Sedimentisphaerales bacterium]|nr:alpha-ketoacid dehydrogenase subunit beta [Sedimentisphaerales bacterium]
QAAVRRAGADATLIGFGRPTHAMAQAAADLEKDGIDVEVIDLRSLRPLDEETILASVAKTHRCVVVDESWPIASYGAYVAWLISSRCFDLLDAPVELVSSRDVPMPYNHRLELAVQPSPERIIDAVKKVLYV